MGSADVVPGVSGGTVALVLGIYEKLVHSIREGARALGSLVRSPGEFTTRLGAVDWRFLIPLLTGIGLAILSLARLIEHLLDNNPREMAGLFFGLVAGSIALAWGLVTVWSRQRALVAAATAVAAFALLGLRGDEITDPALVAFLGAGAIAVVAMILPGISGSFILLMIGMYAPVLDAVNDRDLAVLGVFAMGAVAGLAAFSTLLDRMLASHHDTVMAALIGLMAGSLRVLWPWPDGTENARLDLPTSGDWAGPVLLGVLGLMAVLAISTISRRVAEPSTRHEI